VYAVLTHRLHNGRAAKLYRSAQELVDAILVTVSDQEEQRQLRTHADGIRTKLAACVERAAHLGLVAS
jgi:hypothetical protein